MLTRHKSCTDKQIDPALRAQPLVRVRALQVHLTRVSHLRLGAHLCAVGGLDLLDAKEAGVGPLLPGLLLQHLHAIAFRMSRR